jgi:radical SAM protein (TIGR01212 family)
MTEVNVPFLTASAYWRKKYGVRVQKVPVDAGMGCPHRKDRRGNGGCIYCDEHGSGSHNILPELQVREQVLYGVEGMLERARAEKFISYLQSFTNTFGPPDFLEKIYEASLCHPSIVGLSIGTRPDLLPPKTLDLLQKFSEKTDLTLELGVESFNEETIKWMNRAHPIEKTFEALENLKKRNIKTVTHLIFGAPMDPEDTPEKAAEIVNKYNVHGVKLHNLTVIKNTQLEKIYNENPFKLFDIEEYCDYVTRLLINLKPDTVIHRTHTIVDRNGNLVAPEWSGTHRMNHPKDLLIQKMRKAGCYQGKNFRNY